MQPQRMATRTAIETKPGRVILASATFLLLPNRQSNLSANLHSFCNQTDEFKKGVTFAFVTPLGEEFLELIDKEHDALVW